MLTDEGDISIFIGVNNKKNSDGTFELSQSHLVEKTVNHAGITVSTSRKSRELTTEKTLLHKEEYSLRRKCIWNYRSAIGMLIHI